MKLAVADMLASVLSRLAVSYVNSLVVTTGVHTVLDFGPVFLPSSCALPVLRVSPSPSSYPFSKEDTLSVCCFMLPILSDKERQDNFFLICRKSRYTLFFDFKSPERNLEWPAALLAMPLRACLSRCPIRKQRSLEAVLYSERSRFSVLLRKTVLGGAFSCILVQNSR